jgi:hypothetical protein
MYDFYGSSFSRVKNAIAAHPFLSWTIVYGLFHLFLITATYRHYGVVWDETLQAIFGKLSLNFFTSGLKDTSTYNMSDIRFYGPVFEMLTTIIAPWKTMPNYEVRHFLTALTGLGTGIGVIAFGRALGMLSVSIFAPLFLLLMPSFYGHEFFNSKDMPFACGVTWTLFGLTRFLADRVPGWRKSFGLGVAAGLTLAIRPGGAPLLVAFSAPAIALIVWQRRSQSILKPLLIRCVVIIALAWLLMIAFWPWAYASPLLNPLRTMIEASRFHTVVKLLYMGAIWQSNLQPWHYLLVYTLITTPLPLLFLAGIGAIATLKGIHSFEQDLASPDKDSDHQRGRRARREAACAQWRATNKRKPLSQWVGRQADGSSMPACVLLSWTLLPQVLFLVLRPNVYDGIRHFLFMLPSLALFAALGATVILTRIPARMKRFGAVLILLACLWPLPAMLRLHPYEYTYYNELVGGVRGAAGRFETDYWLESYNEAADWINREAHKSAKPVRVLVAANKDCAPCALNRFGPSVTGRFKWGHIQYREIPSDFDYYIGTTRYNLADDFPESPIVHVVGREGVVFTVIRARR